MAVPQLNLADVEPYRERGWKWYAVIVAITLLVVTGLTVAVYLTGIKSLPVLGHVSSFQLTDSNGQSFTQDHTQGKVWVADFIFTRCQGPCPRLTANLAQLSRELPQGQNVSLVTVTVDPENDTPAVLKKYAQDHGADLPFWHFLTGSREEITRLMTDQLKLGFAEKIIFHSDRLVLVDGKGRIRAYYTGTDQDLVKRLKRDVALLSKEKP